MEGGERHIGPHSRVPRDPSDDSDGVRQSVGPEGHAGVVSAAQGGPRRGAGVSAPACRGPSESEHGLLLCSLVTEDGSVRTVGGPEAWPVRETRGLASGRAVTEV